MINEDTPFELIDAIYATAEDATAWPVALDRMRAAFNSAGSVIGIFDMHSKSQMKLSASSGFDPEILALYAASYEAGDIRSAAAKLMPVGQVTSDKDRYYDSEAFHRGTAWNEVFVPNGIAYKMNSILFRQNGQNASLPFHRSRKQGPYSDRELALFQHLVPHIQRSIQLYRRIAMLELRAKTFVGVLELMPDAAFLTTAAGQVVMHNAAAENLLNRRDGLSISRGRLTTAHPGEDRQLHRLIADAAANGQGLDRGSGGSLRFTRTEPGAYYVVTIAPVRGAQDRPLFSEIHNLADALVVVAEPLSRQGFPAEEIARVHGLTKAEARLAAAIAAGDAVKSYADRHKLTENTVRWTLKRVMSKTGVSSQSALVRLLTPRPLARK